MIESSDQRPVVLLLLTTLVLIAAATQAYFSVGVSIWLPKQFDLAFSDAIWIYLRVPMSLWLVVSSLLILFRQRLGVYLIELATLFSIVYSCWQVVNLLYSNFSGVIQATHLQIGMMLTTSILWIAGQLFYLWCLRNEKAIVYFNLIRVGPDV